MKYYEETLKDQTDLITPEYFKVWNKGHYTVYKYFIEHIKKIFSTNMTAETLITSLTEALMRVLNHTLYELQEIDIVFFSDVTPVFNLDDLSCDIENIQGDSPCLIYQRMTELQKIRPFNEVIIKNYLYDKIPFEMTKLYRKLQEKNIKYTVV